MKAGCDQRAGLWPGIGVGVTASSRGNFTPTCRRCRKSPRMAARIINSWWLCGSPRGILKAPKISRARGATWKRRTSRSLRFGQGGYNVCGTRVEGTWVTSTTTAKACCAGIEAENKRCPTSTNATISTMVFADNLSANPYVSRDARQSAVCSACHFILNAHNFSSRT